MAVERKAESAKIAQRSHEQLDTGYPKRPRPMGMQERSKKLKKTVTLKEG